MNAKNVMRNLYEDLLNAGAYGDEPISDHDLARIIRGHMNALNMCMTSMPVPPGQQKQAPTGHTDALGKDLHIGDTVVFPNTWRKELRKGKIIRLGPKKATLLDDNHSPGVDYTDIQWYKLIVKI